MPRLIQTAFQSRSNDGSNGIVQVARESGLSLSHSGGEPGLTQNVASNGEREAYALIAGGGGCQCAGYCTCNDGYSLHVHQITTNKRCNDLFPGYSPTVGTHISLGRRPHQPHQLRQEPVDGQWKVSLTVIFTYYGGDSPHSPGPEK